jgi:uncharacterized protein (TIGR00369 family)
MLEVKQLDEKYLSKLREEFDASPFQRHLGIEIETLEVGKARLRLPITPFCLNVNGRLHGGVVTSLLDSIMGLTIRSQRDTRIATVSLTTQFLAPADQGDVLFATGTIITQGKRIISIEAVVNDQQERIIAKAIGTFAVVRGSLEERND